ncbi:hypothetical protein HMPREF9446_01628 [Bacteroides fluxus YIT 12057]|uniref:Uncharacterized protein n=1 Tax=Bacteroides fluxus YIT 12057 TaxID=763034 RepID=F3PS94_9BACE|nr:hypothetical protein HMPREF9446_01628 [Bacteroides fluxus YIT 12057]
MKTVIIIYLCKGKNKVAQRQCHGRKMKCPDNEKAVRCCRTAFLSFTYSYS